MKLLKIKQYQYFSKKSLKPKIISFINTNPDSKIISICHSLLKKSIKYSLKNLEENVFSYSPTQGHLILRQSLVNWIKKNDLLSLTSNEIIITNGAHQAINLIAQTLTKSKDTILVENTSYLGIQKPFQDKNITIKSFPKHLNQLTSEEIKKLINLTKPKLIYLVPELPNLTGQYLSTNKRKLIANLAKKQNFYILEDQTHRQLAYPPGTKSTPTIASLNPNTLTVNSLSKIISPGLRIGWLTTKQQKLIKKIVQQKESSDLSSPTLNQIMTAYILDHLTKSPKILNQISNYYQKKLDLLNIYLKKCLPPNFSWNKHHNGFILWLTGPKSFNSQKLFQKAIKNQIAFIPGHVFFFQESPPFNTIRLSVSHTPINKIKIGVKKLAQVISS